MDSRGVSFQEMVDDQEESFSNTAMARDDTEALTTTPKAAMVGTLSLVVSILIFSSNASVYTEL
jgi:hypothetical protein